MINNSDKQETAYISKYAVTSGIIICTDGHFAKDGSYAGRPPGWMLSSYFSQKDAYRTLEEALADGEKRRLKKIEALKKQIKRLEELEIKVKE